MFRFSINQIEEYAFEKKEFLIDNDALENVSKSFHFLVDFSKNKIIYGINTGFGPMAQYKIDSAQLNQLQYNLIRSHSCGVGNVLSETYVRCVVLSRLINFLQGHSGVSNEVINQLIAFLNNNILPEIFEHGGVGASGDLTQLAHLGLNLIGEGYVYQNGERTKTADALKKFNIQPLKLQLRDGLGIINGTSCMSGIAAVNLIYAYRLLDWSIAASAIVNEIVCSFDDSFSEQLNSVKRHKGQQQVAAKVRSFLSDSKLIRNRIELFEDHSEFQREEFTSKIQEYYSIRCVPQILGAIADTLDYAKHIIEDEINSTNDNPVVMPEEDNVFHGGNFHGDYISLEMDKVKLALTKLSMLAERQLNFLLNDRLNEKFPPFLNAEKLGLNFGLQGAQYTATSTTAENQALCNSVYVHSIPSNKDNQDIVSMGTNSAIITKKVLENSFQVMAIHLIAICQAIDLLEPKEKEKISTKTKEVYSMIRTKVKFITDDISHSDGINAVCNFIKEQKVGLSEVDGVKA